MPNISGSPAHGLPQTEIFQQVVLNRAQTCEILRALNLVLSREKLSIVGDFKAEAALDLPANLDAVDEPTEYEA